MLYSSPSFPPLLFYNIGHYFLSHRPDSQSEVDTTDTRIQPSGATLTITSVQASDTGEYVCSATNELDSASAAATLTVSRELR